MLCNKGYKPGAELDTPDMGHSINSIIYPVEILTDTLILSGAVQSLSCRCYVDLSIGVRRYFFGGPGTVYRAAGLDGYGLLPDAVRAQYLAGTGNGGDWFYAGTVCTQPVYALVIRQVYQS